MLANPMEQKTEVDRTASEGETCGTFAVTPIARYHDGERDYQEPDKYTLGHLECGAPYHQP